MEKDHLGLSAFYILVQTEEQQQEGYFNNWVSKNNLMSAVCQPFVLKNSLSLKELCADCEDCILKPIISFVGVIAPYISYNMQKTAAGRRILIILDLTECFFFCVWMN